MTIATQDYDSSRGKCESEGYASLKKCPRSGTAFMSTNNRELLAVPTNCKSWRCKSCRDRKLNMVASLIQYGILEGQVPLLLSVTYAAPGPRQESQGNYVNAERAQKDWNRLLRTLKKDYRFHKIKWFKVIELTKRKQIHFHLIMTDVLITTVVRCSGKGYGKHAIKPDWPNLPKAGCDCIQCTMSTMWKQIQNGQSWIIDVRPVYEAIGASWYLCKYLRKSMYGLPRQELEQRGFNKRYARSKNWAKGVQMKRLGTLKEKWKRHSFAYGGGFQWLIKQSEDHPLMEQVGTNLAAKQAAIAKRKRYANIHEKIRSS